MRRTSPHLTRKRGTTTVCDNPSWVPCPSKGCCPTVTDCKVTADGVFICEGVSCTALDVDCGDGTCCPAGNVCTATSCAPAPGGPTKPTKPTVPVHTLPKPSHPAPASSSSSAPASSSVSPEATSSGSSAAPSLVTPIATFSNSTAVSSSSGSPPPVHTKVSITYTAGGAPFPTADAMLALGIAAGYLAM